MVGNIFAQYGHWHQRCYFLLEDLNRVQLQNLIFMNCVLYGRELHGYNVIL